MLANAAFRKVQSISEGNFHGCYASNKAEKFKFRRLSQGLESCAHAQALKLRKDQKELQKLLQNLKKEKEKHCNEKRDKQLYLQLMNDSHHCDSEYSLEEVKLPNDEEYNSNNNNNNSSHKTVKLSGSSTLSTKSNVKANEEEHKLPNRKKKLQKKPKANDDMDEVVPFYMQHGYSHYHYDPHYDDLLKTPDTMFEKDKDNDSEEPCWKKNSNLSRLKLQRNTISSIDEAQIKNFNSKLIDESKESIRVESRLSNVPSQRSVTTDLAKVVLSNSSANSKHSRVTLPNITESNEKRSSFLTPLERQELAQHHRGRTSLSFSDAERKAKVLLESQRARRHTCHGAGKAVLMKKMIQNRLLHGENIKDLLNEETFDDVLDSCDDGRLYPAYDPDIEFTFEDFRALRKCKYLRIFELNLQSLKEATLHLLDCSV